MWLGITSSSNRASRDGNGNSLCKHLEMLKPLSTSGTQQAKGQLKFPAQTLLTAEVRGRGCLLGTSFRVMRWHSHRNQEALENLSCCDQKYWTKFKSFRSQTWPYGTQEIGSAGSCQGTCGIAGAGVGARQRGQDSCHCFHLPPVSSLPDSGGTSGSCEIQCMVIAYISLQKIDHSIMGIEGKNCTIHVV